MVGLGSACALLCIMIIIVIIIGKGKLSGDARYQAPTPTLSPTPSPSPSPTETPTPLPTLPPVVPDPVVTVAPVVTEFPVGKMVEGRKLYVSFKGTDAVAGYTLTRDDFIVSWGETADTAEITSDYTCEALESGLLLKEGNNRLDFVYEGLTSTVTIKAKDIYKEEYAPDYIAYEGQNADKLASDLADGKITLTQAFEDWGFIGDSQVDALSAYAILPKSSVVAETGSNTKYLLDNYDSILEMLKNKNTLVIHTGINNQLDQISVRINYIQEYASLIDKLKEDRPDLRIIVTGIFPVSEKKAESSPMYGYIKTVNFMLCQMSISKGVAFVNCSEYIDEHPEYFSADGLHMETKFYTDYWLGELLGKIGD